MNLIHFQKITQEDISKLISYRNGEQKIGEKMIMAHEPKLFHILGINESIGVEENFGIKGTGDSFFPFLRSFLNVQSNDFLSGKNIEIGGLITINNDGKYSNNECLKVLDDFLANYIKNLIKSGKIPIIIGGGHNNAYGNLKGLAQAIGESIHVINCDPHADLRSIKKRHSGNGFSFAIEDGYLTKYSLLALHESYNNQFIIDKLKDYTSHYFAVWWEDIFLRKKITWTEAIDKAITAICDKNFGVELDMDAIENVLSSAMTPVGISAQQATEFLYAAGQNKNSSYLHLPEGITQRYDGLESNLQGKLLSYLVISFIKGKEEIRYES